MDRTVMFSLTSAFVFLQTVAAPVVDTSTDTEQSKAFPSEVPTVAIPPTNIPPPFKIIWNYPDFACWGKKIDFNLDYYGIESNGKSFMGDTISLYYHLGKWPRVDLRNLTKWRDGGLPQYGNLTAHLESVREGVKEFTSPTAFGYGVIDMESWRPILETSYGFLKPYREVQMKEIAKTHPYLSDKDQWNMAMQIWYPPARVLMESTLKLVKFIRPRRRWGYYGYPEASSYGTANDRLTWLWNISTVFYPSIYIYSFNESMDYRERAQVKVLLETFRVRAKYGDPDAPIMVYNVVQTPSLGMFEGKWLDLAVKMPLEMGVDGLILWGSSNNYRGNSTDKCLKIQSYVKNTLGPKIKALFERMTQCSLHLCGAKGRCVLKRYAHQSEYLKDRGMFIPKHRVNITTQRPPHFSRNDTVKQDFLKNYVCQCYTGWTGEWCGLRY